MTELRSDEGQVLVALFAGPDGFPSKQHAFAWRVVPARDAGATAVFGEVPAGPVAVAIVHDENGNGRLDTSFIGMPKEGYGFSRGARGRFGPPDFEDASLDLAAGAAAAVPVTPRYP